MSNRKEKERAQLGDSSAIIAKEVKTEVNEYSQDRSKFKKVEMSVFNGSDPDS